MIASVLTLGVGVWVAESCMDCSPVSAGRLGFSQSMSAGLLLNKLGRFRGSLVRNETSFRFFATAAESRRQKRPGENRKFFESPAAKTRLKISTRQ
jgi:hypothetical protein